MFSKLWSIWLEAVRKILKVITHYTRRVPQGALHRRFRTRIHQRRYIQLGGYGERFSSGTCFPKVRSTRQNMCPQIFWNRKNYTETYPIQSKKKGHEALNSFIHEGGLFHELQTDGAKTLTDLEWKNTCKRMRYVPLKRNLTHLGKIQLRSQSDKYNTGLVVWWDNLILRSGCGIMRFNTSLI